MQSKPTRLSVRNNSDQETPAATNKGAFQETPADVIDEDEPINLDSRSSQGRPRLAQEKLLNEIGALNKEIVSLSEFIFKKGAEVKPEQKKQLKNLSPEKEKKEKLLKRK